MCWAWEDGHTRVGKGGKLRVLVGGAQESGHTTDGSMGHIIYCLTPPILPVFLLQTMVETVKNKQAGKYLNSLPPPISD